MSVGCQLSFTVGDTVHNLGPKMPDVVLLAHKFKLLSGCLDLASFAPSGSLATRTRHGVPLPISAQSNVIPPFSQPGAVVTVGDIYTGSVPYDGVSCGTDATSPATGTTISFSLQLVVRGIDMGSDHMDISGTEKCKWFWQGSAAWTTLDGSACQSAQRFSMDVCSSTAPEQDLIVVQDWPGNYASCGGIAATPIIQSFGVATNPFVFPDPGQPPYFQFQPDYCPGGNTRLALVPSVDSTGAVGQNTLPDYAPQ